MPSAGKYPSSLQNLHPSSLSYITPLLGFSFLQLWARMGNACDPSALSPNMCACFIPNHDTPHVTSCRLGLRAGPSTRSVLFPARTFRLCFHLLLSSSSEVLMGLLLLMPTFWAVPTRLLPLTLHLSPYPSRLAYTHFIPLTMELSWRSWYLPLLLSKG